MTAVALYSPITEFVECLSRSRPTGVGEVAALQPDLQSDVN
jgi:hypothetical protein